MTGGGRAIQWAPCWGELPRNDQEGIPWASQQALVVMRGTFLGEMSRMAVLSSTQANYLLSLADLKSVYTYRGYPKALLNKWLKENTAKRWLLRFEEPRVARKEILPSKAKGVLEDTPLVLKTSFNPVWESFNIQKLRDVIVNTWSDHLDGIYCRLRQSSPTLDDEMSVLSMDTSRDPIRTPPFPLLRQWASTDWLQNL